jgi:hypothetical protein
MARFKGVTMDWGKYRFCCGELVGGNGNFLLAGEAKRRVTVPVKPGRRALLICSNIDLVLKKDQRGLFHK